MDILKLASFDTPLIEELLATIGIQWNPAT